MIVDPSWIVPNSLRLWDNAVPISGRIVGGVSVGRRSYDQRGKRKRASAPLWADRLLTVSEPPCASAI